VAEDDCGNTNQCSFQVQVNRDTSPPAIECPSNMVFNCICPGNTIVLDFFKPTVTDNHDPNPTVVCVPPSLVSSPGVHPVVCTVTDNCGNSNQCSFTVTFDYDTIPPALTCPTNLIVWSCSHSAVANYSVTATDACDANVDLVCTPPSGSLFPAGVTPVVCIATDNCTNRSTCTFTVTVRPLLYNGLCHSTLGRAALNVNGNDELEVIGLGSSGQDGVRIELGESQGLRWQMRLPTPAEVDGRDFLVWQRGYGQTTAGTEIQVSELLFAFSGGRLSLTPSATSYGLTLLRNGAVVYQQNGRTGAFDPPCIPVWNEHCWGEEPQEFPDNPFLPHCIFLLGLVCDVETPTGPVQADAFVITPEDPLPSFTALTALQFQGRDVPVLTLRQERLLMFGSSQQPPLPHRALGQARLVADNGALALADLGSSGQDGVRIELGESKGLRWRMDNPSGAPEGDLEIEVIGRTPAGTEAPVRRISHHFQGGRRAVTPGAGSYEMRLLRQGQVVFQQGGRTGAVDIPPCLPVQHEECVGEEFEDLAPWFLPYCFTFLTIECDWDTSVGPVRADTLVLIPEEPLPPVTAVSAVQMRGRNLRDLPALTLRAERVLKFSDSELRLVCPPDLTVRTCSTNPVPVNFPIPRATGGKCLLPFPIGCVPPSGSFFPPGVTTVHCTVTNACGERAACDFTVTVIDTLVYQSESEPNNVLASATDLGLGGFVAAVGRISPAGDVDYYRFTAPPNSKAWITVDTGGAAWAGANSRDSVLTLYDSAGVVIESDDNDGSGNGADSVLESGEASAIAGLSLTGGVYYLRVTGASSTQIIAPYRLYLTLTTGAALAEAEPNPGPTNANVLVPPGLTVGQRRGNLGEPGDADWFSIRVSGPSLVHISVDADPGRSDAGTDVQVDLFRQNGSLDLFSANSSANAAAAAEGFTFRFAVAGTYFVRVQGATTNVTGAYHITTAVCPLPPLPALSWARRESGLALSWEAASEPVILRASGDLRSWTRVELAPTLDGDRLIAVVPPTGPQQFFRIWSDAEPGTGGIYCCDDNGNCHRTHWPADPHPQESCMGTLIYCYETENSSVCEPN
jgi:hypothetical protein